MMEEMNTWAWVLLGISIFNTIGLAVAEYRLSKFDGSILANSLKISGISKEVRDLSRGVRNLWTTIDELQEEKRKKKE